MADTLNFPRSFTKYPDEKSLNASYTNARYSNCEIKRSKIICMEENNHSTISKIITDYIELTEMSRVYGRKEIDLEKEYNKLLTEYHVEAKNYSLEQADKIYKVYHEMLDYKERSKMAIESIIQAEEKLKEIGQILYESTIHAQINLPAINGSPAQTKSVTVKFENGQVRIR